MKINKSSSLKLSSNSFTNIQDSYSCLEEAIKSIESNEEWIKYLSFQSKFYNYSFNNTLLIFLQNPTAIYVAGFNRWKSWGRFIKKGERGIKIFAPCIYKPDKAKEEMSDLSDETIYIVKGFKLVTVFDISQTVGDDKNLPILIRGLHSVFDGDDNLYKNLLSKTPIEAHESDSLSSKGCYYPQNQSIEIKSNLSSVQKIKTLFHEMAHHIHLSRHFEDENPNLTEVIAESVAFVVCSYFNINSSDYSIPYIKSWSNNADDLKIIACKVQKISEELINIFNINPIDTCEIEIYR